MGFLKDAFLLSFNVIIHSIALRDWQICINSQPLASQYEPLLLVFKGWLFICRKSTRQLSSANQHTQASSVQF